MKNHLAIFFFGCKFITQQKNQQTQALIQQQQQKFIKKAAWKVSSDDVPIRTFAGTGGGTGTGDGSGNGNGNEIRNSWNTDSDKGTDSGNFIVTDEFGNSTWKEDMFDDFFNSF